MNIIRNSIDRPIAVIAAVLLTVLFGLVALEAIPIQLAPDVNRPVITITTNWYGAAPTEVEREIINPQETELAGLEGLQSITSRAETGRARITLEFKIGTSMDRSLLLVANRLDRVGDYPDEADQPTIDTAGSEDNAIAWFILTRQDGVENPIHEFGNFVNDVVKERLERVPGISRVNVFGTSKKEIHIEVVPNLLARYQLTIGQVAQALQAANISISAGDINEGKRRYVVRTEGELNTLDSIREVMIRSIDNGDGLRRVRLNDIAKVSFGYETPRASIRLLGNTSLGMNAERQTGANVIETMRDLHTAVDELNSYAIPAAGLTLRQVYDETIYINSAIDLVQQNIWLGGSMAALILLLFLRSVRVTLMICVAIPVSIIGAFVAMAALGRSINVISLAGIAFAVGMVVDATIVVLENIYRLKEAGHSTRQAAYLGTQQVWGAVLVSALTTVMVFIPILIMELEAGQLFRDIAVAISVSVVLSLIVSVSLIPSLANALFKNQHVEIKRLPLPLIDWAGAVFVRMILGFVRRISRSRFLALIIVVLTTLLASYSVYQLLPKLEYLPEGNRNLLFGIVIPPPGYNLETMTSIAEDIETATRHLWDSENDEPAGPDEPPRIERFFFVATQSRTFLGATAVEPERVAELKPILSEPVFREPGTFGFISQPSIFGRGIGGGRKIELDISGPDLETILQTARRAFDLIINLFPRSEGNEWRPVPGLELGAPEVRVIPDRLRLSDSGITARELAQTIDTFNDGLRISQSTVNGKLIDLILKGDASAVMQTQGIGNLPIVTPGGQTIPVTSVADIELTTGPTEIRHRELFRTITLEVRPNQTIPLESAIDLIRSNVIDTLRQQGLPEGVKMSISGTADKLIETRNAMALNMMISLVIVFLVMAVLFESFIYPLIVMLSVPIAAAGGFVGLAMLNQITYQPLDMLTMLGFIILIGIVVNSAILLVHQTLYYVRIEHMATDDAIITATKNRIRAIFMSTLTSVFGMLPLVLVPGAGSELYRGLGSVVVGGLGLSAVITLLIVPPMMSLLVTPLENRRLKNLKSTEQIAALTPLEDSSGIV